MLANFIAELQRLAQHCKFGEVLSGMLRDRLVVGIMNDRIQRGLLSEKDLTFERAHDLALAQETAEKKTAELRHGESARTPVNQSAQNTEQGSMPLDKSSGSCYR